MNWVEHLRWRDFFPWWRRYNNEPNRATYILREYGAWLVGDILDVGCGRAAPVFRMELGNRYHGLDRIGSHYLTQAETYWDVERAPLPFEDGAFDTVLCIGMLEHVRNPHEVLAECFRVARCYVLVQLPNNWPGLVSDFLRGHNYTHKAGYGLPVEAPETGHRHLWWFNFEEAAMFLLGNTAKGWKVSKLDASFEKGNDSWLAIPWYSRLCRYTYAKGQERFSHTTALGLAIVRPFVVYPIQLVEWLLGLVVWGWRGKVVYHNLMCRELWVLYEKEVLK